MSHVIFLCVTCHSLKITNVIKKPAYELQTYSYAGKSVFQRKPEPKSFHYYLNSRFIFSTDSITRSHQLSNSLSSVCSSGCASICSTVERIPSLALTSHLKSGTSAFTFELSNTTEQDLSPMRLPVKS